MAEITSSQVKIGDYELLGVPKSKIMCMKFSPQKNSDEYLIIGCLDGTTSYWHINDAAKKFPITTTTFNGPVFDMSWHDDSTKVYLATDHNRIILWDLLAQKVVNVAKHFGPIKTCNYYNQTYKGLMTTAGDKTVKFWDLRTSESIITARLSDNISCADVDYPMATVICVNREAYTYSLQYGPQEYRREMRAMPHTIRTVAIFRNPKQIAPLGYIAGSIDGRAAVRYVAPTDCVNNYLFRANTSEDFIENRFENVFPINKVVMHPVYSTFLTAGSDGIYTFWDRETRHKLYQSQPADQAIIACDLNSNGETLAYCLGYDWTRGNEYFDPTKTQQIFLHKCLEEAKPLSREAKAKLAKKTNEIKSCKIYS